MRSEYKFLIAKADVAKFKAELLSILPLDQNIQRLSRPYNVQSLYFDSWNDTDLHNKIDGLRQRKKVRIRLYDGDISTARLEIKVKNAISSKKITHKLSSELFGEIVNGNFNRLLLASSDLTDFLLMYGSNLWPTSVISYDRSAYDFPTLNVRVTVDTNIVGFGYNLSFPVKNQRAGFRLTPMGLEVVEVKYKEILPVVLHEFLARYKLTRSAISKYGISRHPTNLGRYNDNSFLHF